MRSYSIETEVAGTEHSARCRVPEKELLTALKIHSGRRADLRDIIVLVEGADLNRILGHARRGDPEKLRAQADRMLEMLEDPRLVDSLTGVFDTEWDVPRKSRKLAGS